MKQKAMLIPLVFLLMLASTLTPAMAIGPQNAEKNPNIMITPEGVELLLPSGVINEWMADTDAWYLDFMHILDASKAKGLAHTAMPLTIADLMGLMTDPDAALEAENKWGYVSYEVLVELLILEGLSP